MKKKGLRTGNNMTLTFVDWLEKVKGINGFKDIKYRKLSGVKKNLLLKEYFRKYLIPTLTN